MVVKAQKDQRGTPPHMPFTSNVTLGDTITTFESAQWSPMAWFLHGPFTRYVKLRGAHAPRMPGTFSPPQRVSDPDMHHGTCVTHVPWCMAGSLTSGFPWSQWRGKRSRHSRRRCNPQFYYLVRGPWDVELRKPTIADHERAPGEVWEYWMVIFRVTPCKM